MSADDDYLGRKGLTRRLARSAEFIDLFHQVITTLYLSVPHYQDPNENDGPFTDGKARPHSGKIAVMLYAAPGVFHSFPSQMARVAAENVPRDALTLHYIALDHSKPWSRVVVSALYVAGFATLLWPTAVTFVRLAMRFI